MITLDSACRIYETCADYDARIFHEKTQISVGKFSARICAVFFLCCTGFDTARITARFLIDPYYCTYSDFNVFCRRWK